MKRCQHCGQTEEQCVERGLAGDQCPDGSRHQFQDPSWKPEQAWYVKLAKFSSGPAGNQFRTYRVESREAALAIAEPASRSDEWDSVEFVQRDVLKRKPKEKKRKTPKIVSAKDRTVEMFDPHGLDIGEE